LTDAEFEQLLGRLVLLVPDGPLVDWRKGFPVRLSCN
jgi:hypothetical protein